VRFSKGIIATQGGAAPSGSQAGEAEWIERSELMDVQESKNKRSENVVTSFKRRFLVKDKDVPLV
jgi:hypothetical protein